MLLWALACHKMTPKKKKNKTKKPKGKGHEPSSSFIIYKGLKKLSLWTFACHKQTNKTTQKNLGKRTRTFLLFSPSSAKDKKTTSLWTIGYLFLVEAPLLPILIANRKNPKTTCKYIFIKSNDNDQWSGKKRSCWDEERKKEENVMPIMQPWAN